MAIVGDMKISATLYYSAHPPTTILPSPPPKANLNMMLNGGPNNSKIAPKRTGIMLEGRNLRNQSHRVRGSTTNFDLPANSIREEAESFLLNAVNMSFFERLNLAWKIIFPPPLSRRGSNANIAKQRLKMILFSDRCAVSDEAKRKIVNNIVHTLSEFVEIESQDKVQLNVSADSDLGTVYSVSVPVRRVKPEYQEEDETGSITNIEYKDSGDSSVDVRFDFYIPDEGTK